MEKSLRKDLKDLFLKVLCSVFRRQECITVLRLVKIVRIVLMVDLSGVDLDEDEVFRELCSLGTEGFLNFFEDRYGRVLVRPSLKLLTMCFQEYCNNKDLDNIISTLLTLNNKQLNKCTALLN